MRSMLCSVQTEVGPTQVGVLTRSLVPVSPCLFRLHPVRRSKLLGTHTASACVVYRVVVTCYVGDVRAGAAIGSAVSVRKSAAKASDRAPRQRHAPLGAPRQPRHGLASPPRATLRAGGARPRRVLAAWRWRLCGRGAVRRRMLRKEGVFKRSALAATVGHHRDPAGTPPALVF